MAEEVPLDDDAPMPPDGEPAETVSVYVSVYSPFVLSTQTSRKSSETERVQSKKTDFTCDHPTCNYVNKNCSSYAQNKESTDRKEASCPYLCPRKLAILNVIMLKKRSGPLYSCDYPGCTYCKTEGLAMHKIKVDRSERRRFFHT